MENNQDDSGFPFDEIFGEERREAYKRFKKREAITPVIQESICKLEAAEVALKTAGASYAHQCEVTSSKRNLLSILNDLEQEVTDTERYLIKRGLIDRYSDADNA